MSDRQLDSDTFESSVRDPMTPFESVNHFVDRAARIAETPDPLLARPSSTDHVADLAVGLGDPAPATEHARHARTSSRDSDVT
jgi:hypothetical protein